MVWFGWLFKNQPNQTKPLVILSRGLNDFYAQNRTKPHRKHPECYRQIFKTKNSCTYFLNKEDFEWCLTSKYFYCSFDSNHLFGKNNFVSYRKDRGSNAQENHRTAIKDTCRWQIVNWLYIYFIFEIKMEHCTLLNNGIFRTLT